MSIVCGTDLSERAQPALSAAAAIASRLQEADLWLVHVLDSALWLVDVHDAATSSLASRIHQSLREAAE